MSATISRGENASGKAKRKKNKAFWKKKQSKNDQRANQK